MPFPQFFRSIPFISHFLYTITFLRNCVNVCLYYRFFTLKCVVPAPPFSILLLTYQPHYQERAYEHDEVDIVLLRLYSQFKTEKRTVVAYKGGHVEKDLLNKLNIPCLDLETWGCPKYEQIKRTIVEPLASCGFHLNDNIHHCPMTECHAFWLWFQTYVK